MQRILIPSSTGVPFSSSNNTTDLCTAFPRIAALKVSLESEISWKDINDLDWEWSSYLLRKHWVSLKEGVEDFDQKTHSGTHLSFHC